MDLELSMVFFLLFLLIFSSPERSSSELIPWRIVSLAVHQSTFQIFYFFSRKAEGIYSKLGTNVPYEVPTKCCYFLSRSKIQYVHPGLWLADAFSTSQEWLQGSTPNLTQMFLHFLGPDKLLLLLWQSEIQDGGPGLCLADVQVVDNL